MISVDSMEAYDSKKIISYEESVKLISELKKEGKKAGLCHGGFDLTHPGHVKHFEMAKKLCDVLFVSVTSDRFVSERKGSGRPIYTDKLRAYMIAGIEFVDYVVVTDFKLGVDAINGLKPSFYIKGPDFINKKTPGIESERAAIRAVGGEIKYTTEPPMSTTKIIDYIKNEVDKKRMLLVIDRDGTIIKNDNFLGKNTDWEKEIVFNDDVVNFISTLQTKHQPTKIVVTNQTGVARRFFTCETVEKINIHIDKELARRGVKIDAWEYCPFADKEYAQKNPQHKIDPTYVQEKTKRKPSTDMVTDALKKMGKEIKDFEEIIVIGDRLEDKELADNLKARFIDVNNKKCEELLKNFS
jgi:rfaE bifunctional protein nucleotidyltransferase chain/domain